MDSINNNNISVLNFSNNIVCQMQFRLNCQHISLIDRNCQQCGLYIHSGINISAIKTQSYRSIYPGKAQVTYLRKQASKFEKCIPQYCTLPQVKNTIESLVEVLGLSRQTYAQSLYIYEQASYQLINKKCFESKYAVLYAAASVVIAGKRIHHDRTIPPMQGIKRILNCNYGKKQLCKAQRLILKMLNYSIPNFSFLDFLSFYLMNGGIFTNQHFRDPLKFQHKIDGIVWNFIREGVFMQYDQESLAAYILYKTRKDLKVSEVWNWHIEYYTQIDGKRIKEILQSFDQFNSSKLIPNQIRLNQLITFNSDKVLTISNIPRQRQKAYDKISVEESIKFIKRGYSNIKRQRSNSQSNCSRLQSVRTGSSLNKFAFRIE